MVFSQTDGFDNLLTNLALLNDNKLLRGNGRAYYIDGCEDIKFTMKTFKEKYESNPKLKEVFDSTIENLLKDSIPKPTNLKIEEDEEEEIYLEECVDEENKIWKASDGNYYTEDGDPVDYQG
jgi:hypothetical protein